MKRFSNVLLRGAFRFVMASAFIFLLVAPLASAQTVYMKIGGIAGESKDPAHKGWIEVSSFQYGEAMPAAGGSVNPGQPTPQPNTTATGPSVSAAKSNPNAAGKPAATPSANSIAAQPSVVSPRDANSGMPTGKRQHQPITIAKEVDKASPLLRKAAASGEHIKEVVLEVYGGGKRTRTITLTDAIISSIRDAPAAHGELPRENVTINFTKIEFK